MVKSGQYASYPNAFLFISWLQSQGGPFVVGVVLFAFELSRPHVK